MSRYVLNLAEYGLSQTQVNEALAFFEAHQQEIEKELAAEQSLEPANV